MPGDLCKTYEDARKVFKAGSKFVENAVKYYNFDGYVTDYAEIKQVSYVVTCSHCNWIVCLLSTSISYRTCKCLEFCLIVRLIIRDCVAISREIVKHGYDVMLNIPEFTHAKASI